MIAPALFALFTLVHPMSVSSSKIRVDGQHVRVDLRSQGATLAECLPVDSDDDGRVSQAEVDAARATIEPYLLAGYRLSTDRVPLTGRLESARVTEGKASDATPHESLVDFVLRFEAASDPLTLQVDFRLFREADPMHRDHAQILWNGAEPVARVLWIEEPSWSFDPSAKPRGVLGAYVSLGIEHIVTGYDHLAFLIALVVASRRLRSVVAVVTAFTLAHSVTLALAALGYVDVPAELVEPTIALSIAYVAVRNLFGERARSLWPEAFGFGLIHGLGFAGSIADTLASETQKTAALIGFNVGVEIGQLAIVLVLVGVLAFLSSRASPDAKPSAMLAPRWARLGASSIVAVLGLYWFVTRLASN